MGFYYKNQSVAVRHDGLVFQCVEGTLKSRSTTTTLHLYLQFSQIANPKEVVLFYENN